jgi:hypothetical protein
VAQHQSNLNRIHISLAFDEVYGPHGGATIASVLANAASDDKVECAAACEMAYLAFVNIPSAHPSTTTNEWSLVIRPKDRWLELHLADLWRYRDLLWMFIRRDFVSVYKQTILGPVWSLAASAVPAEVRHGACT